MRGTLLALVALLSIPVHARGEDDADWPRLATFEDGVRLVLHQPQVDAWRDFKILEARLAATLELPDREVLGTIRLRMGTELTLAMNSPSLLFRHSKTHWYYMLGWDAWLKTSDLQKGRWVAAGQLPSAFQKLPDLLLLGRPLVRGRERPRPL